VALKLGLLEAHKDSVRIIVEGFNKAPDCIIKLVTRYGGQGTPFLLL
jgi:hypothetical protein